MENSPLDQEPHLRRQSGQQEIPRETSRSGAKSENELEFIFVDGVMLPFATAALHISKIAAGNGANVFEGMSLYESIRGRFLFRVEDHIANLRKSAWMMDIDCDYSDDDFMDAISTCLRGNRITGDAHIRLSLFVTGDVPSDASGPVSLVCTARSRSSSPIHSRTVHAAISSWRRVEDPLMPPRVRAEANSHNTRFGLLEVLRNGYGQALFVSKAGKVGCGTNASFLMVRDGCLISPPETTDTEERVTRSTLLEIAGEELGLEVQEREIVRGELTYADEAMFCGSGIEICPVLSINKVRVGEGHVGPVTRRLWHDYEATVRGRNERRIGWLTALKQRRHAGESPASHERNLGQRSVEFPRSTQPDRRYPLSGEIEHLLESGYQMGGRPIG